MNSTAYYQKKINDVYAEHPDCTERIRILEKRYKTRQNDEKLVDLLVLSVSYFMASRLAEALEHLIMMINLAVRLKHPVFLVYAYNLIGAIYDYAGAVCYSLEAYLSAIEVAQHHQYDLLLEMVNNNLGELFLKVDNAELACYYYKKSCEKYIDETNSEAFTNKRLMYMGNYIRGLVAVDDIDQAKYVLERIKFGAPYTKFPFSCRFEVLYYDKINDQAALLKAFSEGVNHYNLLTDKLPFIDLMVDYGLVLLRRDMPLHEALPWLEKARQFASEQGLYNKLITLTEIVAEAQLQMGDLDKALASYDKYAELCNQNVPFKKNIILASSHYRLDISLKDYELMLIHEKDLKLMQYENELSKITNRIELVKNLGLQMTKMTDIKKIATTVFSYLKFLMQIDLFFIVIQDKVHRLSDVCLYVVEGRVVEIEEIPFEKPDSLARQCFVEQKTMYIANATKMLGVDGIAKGHRFKDAGWIESAVFTPLIFDEVPIGVFSVQSYNIDQYDENDLKIISEMATFISIAVNSSIINKKLEEEKNNRIACQLKLEPLNEALKRTPNLKD